MIAVETFYTYLMYVKSKKKYEYNDVHEQPREQFYASAHWICDCLTEIMTIHCAKTQNVINESL